MQGEGFGQTSNGFGDEGCGDWFGISDRFDRKDREVADVVGYRCTTFLIFRTADLPGWLPSLVSLRQTVEKRLEGHILHLILLAICLGILSQILTCIDFCSFTSYTDAYLFGVTSSICSTHN
jgi:hypothetical protein